MKNQQGFFIPSTSGVITMVALIVMITGFAALHFGNSPPDVSQAQPTGTIVTAQTDTTKLNGFSYSGLVSCHELQVKNKYLVSETGGSFTNQKSNKQYLSASYKFVANGKTYEGSGASMLVDSGQTVTIEGLNVYQVIQKGLTSCQIKFSTGELGT